MLLVFVLCRLFNLIPEMGRPLVTACIFCLLCATPGHCSSNHESEYELTQANVLQPGDDGSGQIFLQKNLLRRKRSESDFVKSVFNCFGDGYNLTMEGFEKFVRHLPRILKEASQENTSLDDLSKKGECIDIDSLLSSKATSAKAVSVLSNNCLGQTSQLNDTFEHHRSSALTDQAAVWVYAVISVVMISLCGLLAVAVIPLMHHSLYQILIQFLVALAVGTLCGDALLHLLPHAMMSTHADHGHDAVTELEHEDQHETNIWRGFVAAIAIVFFYFIEKCLAFIGQWRKRNERKRASMTKVRVMRDDKSSNPEGGSRVGEKLCKHKYSSYPYCYGEITNNADVHTSQGPGEAEINNITTKEEMTAQIISNHKGEDNEAIKEDVPSSEKQLLENSKENRSDYTTIILREHETRHHGHAHTHGHVHSAPNSLGSVVWMVVLGDGIHNFTDGLAIGAAFASNIGGGISTAVAVFCHELPHELGDFAMLLKAGMSARDAVCYNLLSSVLCLIGMCLGVSLGHNEDMSLWVFSAAAGMFLYIALVDMIPELTSNHSAGSSLYQGLLQLAGLLTGISIMVVIALYEHDLKNAFKHF